MSGTHTMNARYGIDTVERWVSARWFAAILLAMSFATGTARAADEAASPQLDDIQFSSLPGNRVQVDLVMTGAVKEPRSFTTDTPARIALDFPDTTSNLTKKTFSIGVGVVRSVAAVQGKNRTRVVLDLVKMVPYQTRLEGNHYYITVEGGEIAAATPAVPMAGAAEASAPMTAPETPFKIDAVDFRRGVNGEGRVLITLSDASIPVNIHEEGNKIVLDFAGTSVPKKLQRRLDVVDFATPITMVDTFPVGKDTRMVITATGNYEHLAYQAERQFTVEVKPVTKAAKESAKKNESGYSGEKLSLNFQDIKVRSALQIIADFTGLNMVVSDSVKGSISLRLKNVPWDQALDIILRTKGLGMRKMGNVMLVAPSAELSAREKEELEAQQKITELEPTHSELIQINYAKAADIAAFLRAKGSSGTATAGTSGTATPSASLLSDRGTVTVDERTNSLLIQDTASRLAEIRKMITQLDIPVRQVLIESRIVIANDDFSRDLGARFGVTNVSKNGNSGVVSVTGNANGNDTVVNSAISNLSSGTSPYPVTMPILDNRLNVDLPVASPAGSIGLAILGKNSLVDLELSALQAEGRGEVVSNPRVITANQKEATIEQGVEIPYQEASSSGATSVSFKKAVLSLKVTPQITPDDRVIMDLNVSKDSVGDVFAGVPSINTREVNTQVLVQNGQTVVLGGIYETTRSKKVNKIPLLGDLPYLGVLFRNTSQVNNKVELLIFVTPKILKESLGAN
jgi:type IV pilus assembly protein PilQ